MIIIIIIIIITIRESLGLKWHRHASAMQNILCNNNEKKRSACGTIPTLC